MKIRYLLDRAGLDTAHPDRPHLYGGLAAGRLRSIGK